MNELWLNIWALVGAVLGTFLLVLLSALIERSSPIRLRHWAEKAGPRLRELYDAPPRFEAFRLLLSVLARLAPVAALWALWGLLGRLEVAGAPWIAFLAVACGLCLAEWVNRFLVGLYSEEALHHLRVVLRVAYLLLLPAVWLLSRFVAQVELEEEDDDEDVVSEQELDAYIDVGRREGILEPEEEELVRSIVDFGDTQVRSVMTPRVDIVSAPIDSRLEDLGRLFFESKHARLPLYRESIDQIVGILHIRDLCSALHSGGETNAEKLSNAPLYVPESKGLRQLLEEMQALQQQMAIVLDEYGGVAGLVTVEDLVEEIVGEIADEHEIRSSHRTRLDDGRWRLLGRTEVEKLEELFDVDFGELPYETVSGLICGELGYVPKAGEEIESHGLVMAIEEADERRVKSVVVLRSSSEEEG
ncbi:MAG: HlyC/CorC family transporter [bacterium]|nr:HlyC/CorC family transporter [bacterium]